MEAKIIGKVTAPIAPNQSDFDSLADYDIAMAEYRRDLAEFEKEQNEAAELRAKAEAGDHGPAEAGPGAGSPDYDDGNIRVIR